MITSLFKNVVRGRVVVKPINYLLFKLLDSVIATVSYLYTIIGMISIILSYVSECEKNLSPNPPHVSRSSVSAWYGIFRVSAGTTPENHAERFSPYQKQRLDSAGGFSSSGFSLDPNPSVTCALKYRINRYLQVLYL